MTSFTLQDITNKLFQYFTDNNVFCLEENHADIFEPSIDPPLERAALLKSLEKFQQQKLVSRLDVDGKSVFLLEKPLQSFSQSIELSGETAGRVAQVINCHLQRTGNAEYRINPLETSERAIQLLAVIAEKAAT